MPRRKKRRPKKTEPPQGKAAPRKRLPLKRVAAILVLAAVAAAVVLLAVRRDIDVPTPPSLEHFDRQVQAHLRRYIKHTQERPRDPARQAELGNVYAAHSLWPEALHCFANAAALNPGEPLALYHQAVALENTGDTAGAFELLVRLVEKHGDFAPGPHRLGSALLDRGRVDEAVECFERAIVLAPQSAAGYRGLGEARINARQHRDAIAALEKAVELDRGDRMAHYLLGTAYNGIGQTQKASAHLARGVGAARTFMDDAWSVRQQSHDMTVDAQIRRALELQAGGSADQAVKVLESALKWHPNHVELLNNLAVVYLRSGRLDRADRTLEQARRIDAERFETHVNLSTLALERGHVPQALQAAERAVALAPEVSATQASLGAALRAAGRSDEALEAYRLAARYDNEDIHVLAALVDLCYQFGLLREGKGYIQAVLRLDPNNFGAQIRLCDTHIRLGEIDEALTVLDVCRRRQPDHPDVARMAGMIETLSQR